MNLATHYLFSKVYPQLIVLVRPSFKIFYKKSKRILILTVGLVALQHNLKNPADVAKLVDALDLGSSASRHGGSSPFIRTA